MLLIPTYARGGGCQGSHCLVQNYNRQMVKMKYQWSINTIVLNFQKKHDRVKQLIII